MIVGKFSGDKPHVAFYGCVGIVGVELIIAIFLLAESKKKENDIPVIPWYQNNPFTNVYWMFSLDFVPAFVYYLFFANISHNIAFANFVLWADYRFQWNNLQVGIAILIFAATAGFAQSVLVKIFTPIAGEKYVYVFALMIGIAGYFGLALTPTA